MKKIIVKYWNWQIHFYGWTYTKVFETKYNVGVNLLVIQLGGCQKIKISLLS